MPRRKKVTRIYEHLTAKEKTELEDYDLTEAELEKLEKRLATNSWAFGSKPKRLRLELHFQDAVTLTSGKVLTSKESLSATFQPSQNPGSEHEKGRFETNDRRTAMLIYLADDYDKGFWDVKERATADFEDALKKFKQSVKGDEAKLSRLREDLAQDAAKV